MAIADIVNEIDAYLLRLRSARALLATVKDARRMRAGRSGGKAKVKTVASAAHERRVRDERPSSETNAAPAVQAPVSDVRPVVERLPVAAEPAAQVSRDAVPIQRLRASRRGERRMAAKPALSGEAGKPAIALSSSMNRIVVVAPEQLQRERDRGQTVAAAVQRPRVPSTGLTGRLAFEALFKDTIDPSKASGQ